MSKESRRHAFSILVMWTALAIALSARAASADSPDEYFPLKVGMKWEYEIRLGGINPLVHQMIIVPLSGGGHEGYVNRFTLDPSNKTSMLILKVVSSPQMMPGSTNTVSLIVERDDIGLFRSAGDMYIATYKDPDFRAVRAFRYSSSSDEVAALTPQQPGAFLAAAKQQIFVSGRQGSTHTLPDDTNDILTFRGFDTDAPGYGGTQLLRITRIVKPLREVANAPTRLTVTGFVEEMWFAKGRGLVLLRQQVDGKISMTWELKR